MNVPGLVSSILASDLNPMAIKLLHENLSRWIGMPSDPEVTGITEWKEGVWSGVADAREPYGNGSSNWILEFINYKLTTQIH